MNVAINKEVFNQFDKRLRILLISVKNFDNKTKLKESSFLLEEIAHLVRLTFHKDNIKTHGLISPWNMAQEKFGEDAKHYQTSVERLIKNVMAKKSVKHGDVLTNILRYVALKHVVPFGVDDYDKIIGDLHFSVANGHEKVGVLKKLKKGALYYHDNKNILGTKLDYWKSKKTALDKNSTKALIHFEVLPPLNLKKMKLIQDEIVSLIRAFCGGRVKVTMIDKKLKSATV